MDNQRKNEFERLGIIIGDENLSNLEKKHIAIFGLGGVGSFAAEAIIRSNVGIVTLIDYDKIDITNINRQLSANHNTIGRYKVDVLKERFLSINPRLKINTICEKFTGETHERFFQNYDYIIDAIDLVSSKVSLIVKSRKKNIPLISSMGMGNKLNPLDIKVAPLSKTHTCPLAKVMRAKLKKYDITDIKCVFSTENPTISKKIFDDDNKMINGSCAFVPSVAGLVIASEVIKDLIDINKD